MLGQELERGILARRRLAEVGEDLAVLVHGLAALREGLVVSELEDLEELRWGGSRV